MGAAEEPIPLKAGKRQIKVGPFMTVNYAEWKKNVWLISHILKVNLQLKSLDKEKNDFIFRKYPSTFLFLLEMILLDCLKLIRYLSSEDFAKITP